MLRVLGLWWRHWRCQRGHHAWTRFGFMRHQNGQWYELTICRRCPGVVIERPVSEAHVNRAAAREEAPDAPQ